nr:S-adenosylmethionine:tRNA ribosyltransferase-isomerase [uncultured Sediminibacterium sp.]
MHPKDIAILDFTYDLPVEKIAQYPLSERDQSKLLVFQQGKIQDTFYHQLPTLLSPQTLLVFNNTKVVEARLLFQKSSGSTIEVFCLEPDDQYPDITTAMLQKGKVYWKCLVGGAKKWKEPVLQLSFTYQGKNTTLTAKKINQALDYYIISLEWNNIDLSFAEVLHAAGNLPLPPYMNRAAEPEDHKRYQTVYAKHDGSVAAPTAGLHFTPSLLENLAAAKIDAAFVTLHVGAGTFKPVKATRMQDHDMHAEYIDLSIDIIEQLRSRLKDPIIAVGTTSLRTLESIYWLGVKTLQDPSIKPENLTVTQWEPYESSVLPESSAAIEALLNWMKQHEMKRLITKTSIIIAPGYQFKMIRGLITNFHQPQSTLLLLVAAITGPKWKDIYHHALTNGYRFLSYGDGCLLWCNTD